MATECGTLIKPVYRVSLEKEPMYLVCWSLHHQTGVDSGPCKRHNRSRSIPVKTIPFFVVQGKTITTTVFDPLPVKSFDTHVLTEKAWFPSNAVV